MIWLTHESIDPDRVMAIVQSELAGACVLFLGTTRKITGDRETVKLEYECYQKMAEKKMQQLVDEAHQRWAIQKCCIVHRLGTVEVGEASVAVAVSSAHREPAFAAASWLIDTLKKIVPIWKQEFWKDGSVEWVHPGVKSPSKVS